MVHHLLRQHGHPHDCVVHALRAQVHQQLGEPVAYVRPSDRCIAGAGAGARATCTPATRYLGCRRHAVEVLESGRVEQPQRLHEGRSFLSESLRRGVAVTVAAVRQRAEFGREPSIELQHQPSNRLAVAAHQCGTRDALHEPDTHHTHHTVCHSQVGNKLS